MEIEIGLGAAAFAGLLSFLSPCILPIVPFYLCYMAGLSFETLAQGDVARRRVVWASVLFSAGVATVFFGLGATATWFGQQMRDYYDVLRYGAAGLVLLMGLHVLGVVRIGALHAQARVEAGAPGLLGAYVVGMAFAFGWTPCVGPVLAAVLFLAAEADSAAQGGALLLAYAWGMTLPFILAALFIGPFLRWARGFRRHLRRVEVAMGGLLILFAALIATDSVSVIAGWMLRIAPDIGTLR